VDIGCYGPAARTTSKLCCPPCLTPARALRDLAPPNNKPLWSALVGGRWKCGSVDSQEEEEDLVGMRRGGVRRNETQEAEACVRSFADDTRRRIGHRRCRRIRMHHVCGWLAAVGGGGEGGVRVGEGVGRRGPHLSARTLRPVVRRNKAKSGSLVPNRMVLDGVTD
jgi:hypothetical protein